MAVMAKQKPKGGKHKTPRKPMLIPEKWDALAQELAEEAEQPKMWYVVGLIKAAAEAKGKKTPPPPWVKGKEDQA